MEHITRTARRPRLRLRRGQLAIAVAVLAAAGIGAAVVTLGRAAPAAGPAVATGTATIIRTNLTSTQQVTGSLGYLDTYTIALPGGASPATTISSGAQTQAQASAAAAQLVAAQNSVTDARAVGAQQVAATLVQTRGDQQVVGNDNRQLGADQNAAAGANAAAARDCTGGGTPSASCTTDRQAAATAAGRVATDQASLTKDGATLASDRAKVSVAQVQARQAIDQARAQVSLYLAQLQGAQGALSAVQGGTLAGRTISGLPKAGVVVAAGQPVYWLDGVAVPLLLGGQSAYRPFQPGMSGGPDVTELQRSLSTLGLASGVGPTGRYDAATQSAVRALQARLGDPVTGVLGLGQVVFAPTAARVTALVAAAGTQAQPGAVVLTASSTTRAVIVPLQVAQEYLVKPGDKVAIDLPNGHTTTTGRVSQISAVATAPASASPGPAGTAGSGTGGQSSVQAQQQAASTTVPVTISLDDPSVAGRLDQAPVTVDISGQSVTGVLAVPVQALIALAGGGYAVQLTGPSGHRLLPVSTGLFGNGIVQISGPGVSAGLAVQVPAG